MTNSKFDTLFKKIIAEATAAASAKNTSTIAEEYESIRLSDEKITTCGGCGRELNADEIDACKDMIMDEGYGVCADCDPELYADYHENDDVLPEPPTELPTELTDTELPPPGFPESIEPSASN